jgi:hypothetical protein
MTNTMIFAYIPHEITQWKILPFLTPKEQATFNSVLEQPERIIFTYIPHDITQWKISPFLTPEERATFNSALEPPERVYKKFPTDFAIKHSLRTFITAQKRHVQRIAYLMENTDIVLGAGADKASLKKAIRSFKKYVSFISSLQARLIYQYKNKAQKGAFNDLSIFMDDDFPYRLYVTQEFREQMWDAWTFVEESTFIRDVPCNLYS